MNIKPKQKHNNDKMPIDTTSSQPCIKPNVVCSQSQLTDNNLIIDKSLTVDVTENRVWVQIGNVGVGFEKENFVKLIMKSESYKYALRLWE